MASYGVLLALALTAVLWFRPDEADLPRQSRLSWPDVRIEGLSARETASRPGFTATSARPGLSAGVVHLGDRRQGLDLVGVAVELASGCVLRATEGQLEGQRLTLCGKVWLERDGQRRLDTGRAELWEDWIRFPELVVFSTPRGRRDEVDLTLSRSQLLSRLR